MVVLLEHRQKLLVRNQLKNEFHTAVEVESETDRTRGVLADQAHHIAVVLQIVAVHFLREIQPFRVGCLQQRLRLVKLWIGFLERFRLLHHLMGLGILLVLEHAEEGFIIVALEERMDRQRKDQHHHHGDQRAQNQRSLVHTFNLCIRN